MNLTDERVKQLQSSTSSANECALIACGAASEFIQNGQYEDALNALGRFWQGIGERPKLEGLDFLTAAEVLLQCGVLSGWLGSARHISGIQEKSKDMIFEALRLFKSKNLTAKTSEAQYEISMCYWRLGAFDEARVVLDEGLKGLSEQDKELKAKILIRHTLVEVWTGRYHDALTILEEASEFFESCGDGLKGRWHGQKGLVLRRLATTEKRSDYADKAIIEFTAAIYHYEIAGHERYCARNLNNLAMLLYQLGRYSEAHKNLDRAQQIFMRYEDSGCLAQVNDTRARVYVAEGRYKEANRIISGVIQSFEKGGEYALLSDALTIQGLIWSKLGMHESSMQILRRALSLAQDSGSFANAGFAALTLIQEHGQERLTADEVFDAYRRADEFLKDTQDAEDIDKLRACARLMGRKLLGACLSDEGFVLTDVVLSYEAKFIKEALEAEQGSVSRAARRLGIKHQTLARIINTRHKELLSLRTPAKTRRRSIIRRHNLGSKSDEQDKRHEQVTVLFVADDESASDVLKRELETKGQRVVICSDGATASKLLAGRSRFDLLIFENEVPRVKGLSLVRQARRQAHRKRTPIIMFSPIEVEKEAWRAGVDAFLMKSQDESKLPAMVTRLLDKCR